MECLTVFAVRVWFDDDTENMQVRYVAARNDEEVDQKMEKYRDDLLARGFAELHWVSWGGYVVEIDEVIV